MKKIIYKAAIIIAFILVSFWGLKTLLIWGWEKGKRDSFDQIVVEENKIIIFENKLDSAIYLYIDFKYTDRDSIDFYKKRIDTTFFLSGSDPVYLQRSGSAECLVYREIPLLANDSTDFPKSFSVKIYNQYNNSLLKTIDYNIFMEYAKPKFYTNVNNPLTAIEWTLRIDNTLLGLKDSIK